MSSTSRSCLAWVFFSATLSFSFPDFEKLRFTPRTCSWDRLILRRLVTRFSMEAGVAGIAVILAGTIWRLAGPLNLGVLRAAVAA